jgi:hypothetical protein
VIEPPAFRQTRRRAPAIAPTLNDFAAAPPRRLEYVLLCEWGHMLDREKIVAVLKRRFPASTAGQVAAAANALVGLEDEWMEISMPSTQSDSVCSDGCYLDQLKSQDIRIFRRLGSH